MIPLLWRIIPVLAVIALAVAAWRLPQGPAAAAEVRYLRIAVGPATTPVYQAGTALASTLSRPPGLPPCDPGRACGVPGLVALAQSLPATEDVVSAVASGSVESGLAPAQYVFGARCPLGAGEAPQHVTIVADLYQEALHVLAAPGSGVSSLDDLKGKRVAIGRAGTEDRRLADRVLMAHGLRRADVRMVQIAGREALDALAAGEVDVVFRIGAWPDPMVADLAARGAALLIPVQGAGADALMDLHPFSGPGRIPAGLYGEAGEVATLLQPVVWIAHRDITPDLVTQVTAALARDENRAVLQELDRELQLAEAAGRRLAAPLHPGAAATFGETGTVLRCPGE